MTAAAGELQSDTCTGSGPASCASPSSSPKTTSCDGAGGDPFHKLLRNNRLWSAARLRDEPQYFEKLCNQQSPEYLWIGCSDSRVPANQILGLQPGEVFVQRNVGNQAQHTDLNCMSCLEYSVRELKVRNIIICGHYGCGAVKAALRLPSKMQGLVNCWISDIRDCRNNHRAELMALPNLEDQVNRLCELNVLHQTFNVCTSPVVQAAWDQGQELQIYGCIYSLRDGLIKKLVGPISKNGDIDLDHPDFEEQALSYVVPQRAAAAAEAAGEAPPLPVPGARVPTALVQAQMDEAAAGADSYRSKMDALEAYMNTRTVSNRIAQHVGWSQDGGGDK